MFVEVAENTTKDQALFDRHLRALFYNAKTEKKTKSKTHNGSNTLQQSKSYAEKQSSVGLLLVKSNTAK